MCLWSCNRIANVYVQYSVYARLQRCFGLDVNVDLEQTNQPTYIAQHLRDSSRRQQYCDIYAAVAMPNWGLIIFWGTIMHTTQISLATRLPQWRKLQAQDTFPCNCYPCTSCYCGMLMPLTLGPSCQAFVMKKRGQLRLQALSNTCSMRVRALHAAPVIVKGVCCVKTSVDCML